MSGSGSEPIAPAPIPGGRSPVQTFVSTRRAVLVATAMLASLAAVISPASARPSPGTRAAGIPCTPAWTIVPSPNVGSGDNGFADIDVLAADNAWAVGSSASAGARSTLIQQWNGSSWSIVPSPNGDEPINFLTGVSALSPTNVWAVGYTNDGNGFESQSFNLILHYNGTVWTEVPSPNPPLDNNQPNYPVSNELYGVHAVAANDVWAIGHTFTISAEQTLALHWNGTAWTNVPTPHRSRYSRLRSVDSAAANDVWAVGEIQRRGTQRSLTQHWNGTTWTTVASPNESLNVDYVLGVSVVGSGDAWAVGYHNHVFGFSQVNQTTSYRWNGSKWSLIDAPDLSQENNYLFDVLGLSATNAWAVGFWDTGFQLRTLTEHWNGTSWTVVPSPNRSTYIDELVALDAAPNALWAVGQSAGFESFRTLVLRYGC
jgi:hypothetical protein